jgi:hypothetical protein
LLGVSP